MRKFLEIIILSVFLFFLFSGLSFADEISQKTIKERREDLQKQQDNLDNQIEAIGSVLQGLGKETASLNRDIDILNAKIKKAKLEIQKLDMKISKTKTGIIQKSEQIVVLGDKSEKKKDSLAELIRKNNEIDSTGLAEIVLGYQKMSDFFVVGDSLEPVHRLIQDTLEEIRETKKQTEKEKEDLTEYKDEQIKLK